MSSSSLLASLFFAFAVMADHACTMTEAVLHKKLIHSRVYELDSKYPVHLKDLMVGQHESSKSETILNWIIVSSPCSSNLTQVKIVSGAVCR
jgi:hypothetical protein